jgi:hypothetical protein
MVLYRVVCYWEELGDHCGHLLADDLDSLERAREIAREAVDAEDGKHCVISSITQVEVVA